MSIFGNMICTSIFVVLCLAKGRIRLASCFLMMEEKKFLFLKEHILSLPLCGSFYFSLNVIFCLPSPYSSLSFL